MTPKRMTEIFISPHISEKSTRLADESNQVVFRVRPDAKKLEIKTAVEKLFDVKVVNVNTLNVKGKRKLFKGKMGRRDSYKKAYVRLAAGNDIDFADNP